MLKKTSLLAIILLSTATTLIAREDLDPEPELKQPLYYGTNVLRVAPLTVMDIGVGFGLSYEKLLGKEKVVGIILPVSLILQNNDNYYYQPGTSYNFNTYVCFTPGVKVYPFGQRKVTYALGPNLMVAYGGGKGSVSEMDNFGNMVYSDYSRKVFRVGMVINNYINFQVTPSFNLGLEGGLGIRYLDRQTYDYESGSYPSTQQNINGFDVIGQFSMTLGYRF